MSRRQRAVTLEDVATASGYSRATVSRVVNRSPSVDPVIAAAVERAIRKTGYAANRAARALAGGSSRTIGLVFLESFSELFQNPYWGEIVDATSRVLWDANYQETFMVADSAGRARVEAYLAQRSVDGVILMSASDDDPLATQLADKGFPVAVFGTAPDALRIPSVTVDEELTGAIAARHVLDIERHRPVVISGRPDMQVSRQRVDSFRRHITDAAVQLGDRHIEQGDFTVEGGRSAMAKLLRRHPTLDAVFACSDRMAIGALEVLHDAGRKVPDDVALIGVDGTPLGEMTRPRLTSIGSDHREIGHSLAQLMLDAIGGSSPRRLVFPAHLVLRDSA